MTLPSLMVLSLLALGHAGDWPQFKRSADRQGCALAEQVALPSKLCAWVDFGSPLQASPAVVAGKAYAVSSHGVVARVDLASNTVDWSTPVGGAGNESSPAVANGKVYVGSTTGSFYVLDAATGAVLKQYAAGASILAAPLLLAGGVYFGSLNGNFHALDLNGNLKWVFPARNYVVYNAAAQNGQIVFSDGLNHLYWITDQGASYQLVYDNHLDNGHSGQFMSPPTIFNGGVFLGRGDQEYSQGAHQLTRYDFATGAFDKVVGSASLVRTSLSADTATAFVFGGSAGSGLFGINLGTGSYGVNWSTISYWYDTLGIYGVNSSPAVAGNFVVFGAEDGSVHFFQKDNVKWPNDALGVKLWSYQTASQKAFDASPAVSDGKVVIGSLDGSLYGFWNGTEVTAPVKVDTTGATVSAATAAAPGRWTLRVAPNPSTGGRIRFDLSIARGPAALAIYDLGGSLVFAQQGLPAGAARIQWNGRDLKGRPIAAGSYVAQVREAAGRGAGAFTLKILH